MLRDQPTGHVFTAASSTSDVPRFAAPGSFRVGLACRVNVCFARFSEIAAGSGLAQLSLLRPGASPLGAFGRICS